MTLATWRPWCPEAVRHPTVRSQRRENRMAAALRRRRARRANDRADGRRQREVLRRSRRGRRRRRLRLLDGPRLRDRAGRLGRLRPHRHRRRSSRRSPSSSPAGSAARPARSGGPRSCGPATTAAGAAEPRRRRRSSRCCARPSRASRPAARPTLGDKTLLDALVPATDTIEEQVAGGFVRGGHAAGRRGHRAGGGGGDHGRCWPSAAAPPTPASAASASVDAGRRGRRRAGRGAGRRMAVRPSPPQRPEAIDMKKFVNDPKQFVPEMLQGIAAGQPGHAEVRAGVQPDHACGRAARGQGVDHPGLRFRPRAGARDGRRQGHAGRRLSRRRVRRAADGLRAGDTKLLASPKGVLHLVNNYTGDRMAFDMGREMAEADGRHDRDADRRRRRRGEGLHLHGRPARRGRQLLRDQGGRRGRRRRAPTSTSSSGSARRSTR